MDIGALQHLPEPFIVAEIGCNHRGDPQTAREMIVVAKACGAQVAKFQKRAPAECLTPARYASIYSNRNSYGRTYGEHREFLEFDVSVHRELKVYAEDHGIEYSTSVWDLTSAREIAALCPRYLKVPSACNHHTELMRCLRDEFGGEVHVSVGMCTEVELDGILEVFRDCPDRLVIYSCTSGYPVPPPDVCLLEIERLQRRCSGSVREIGFSGHHNGIALDIAAYLLGARVIERHFTLDRTWKGTDHAASLEPQGIRKLVRDLNAVSAAMTYKSSEVLPIEQVQRDKLKMDL